MEGRWKYKIVHGTYNKTQFDSSNYISDAIGHFEEKVNDKQAFESWEPFGGLVIKEFGKLILITQNLKKFIPFEPFVESESDEFDEDDFE